MQLLKKKKTHIHCIETEISDTSNNHTRLKYNSFKHSLERNNQTSLKRKKSFILKGEVKSSFCMIITDMKQQIQQ